jgi:ADP-ribosylation factor related protein 1
MSKDELKILIVGLDYAGKTTLLEQVKYAYIPQYRGAALEGLPPTIGMNLARVATQRVDVTFWDVGGSVRA